ncbi:YbaB/EbfC family nucleoid-associated protein [Saccharothrix xinjiangensis]|uniref:YbaB/EbfC family nucleoid-associated protein n=1 Tax=Saccharothrix xinjiangensis TaxID=204798 RepID=A0ABV9XPK1_9PSEU
MKTPEEWMRDFEAKIADARAKAAVVQEGLANAGGSASSDDGVVTVVVAPNGALTDVELTDAALRKSPAQLSAEIVEVARKARR